MINTLHSKYKKFLSYLKNLNKAAIAYSVEVDSTFLLYAAKEALGKENVLALTVAAPYNNMINSEELVRIELAEKYLMDMRFRAVRVRSHGDLARIEIPGNEFQGFF